jgi:stage II sporulation protein GA (sporulation sigma-E factor processing peptidase)
MNMQVVYVDSLFLINIVINYILLLVTAKICGAVTPRLRLLGGAALGALYAVAAVLPLPVFFVNLLIKIAVGILMVLIAFGGQARLLRLILVFFAVSAAFGGAVMASSLISGGSGIGEVRLSVSLKILILAFAVAYAILTLVFKRAARRRNHPGGYNRPGGSSIVALELRHGGRVIHMRALRDTGNALTDPLTGRPVIVAGVNDIRPLLAPETQRAVAGLRCKDAVGVMEELAGVDSTMRFHLIPYSAVGIAGGMLLAFKPDGILVDGKNKTGMLLALSPNSVSESGAYTALLGA